MNKLSEESLKAIARNPNFEDKKLLEELAILFQDKPEAFSFLNLYGQYGELVDDEVDEEKSIPRTQEIDRLRLELQAHPYWIRHYEKLCITEALVHITYFDSVQWEKSNSEWKRRDAKALSHCGYNMLFAIMCIEFGLEIVSKFSLRFREHAHARHLHDKI